MAGFYITTLQQLCFQKYADVGSDIQHAVNIFADIKDVTSTIVITVTKCNNFLSHF